MNKRILELTQRYYEQAARDHHKDRDCHFYINQVWSYGDEPYWRIEHYGYLKTLPKYIEDVKYKTYEDAEKVLLELLEEWVPQLFADQERIRMEEELWNLSQEGENNAE